VTREGWPSREDREMLAERLKDPAFRDAFNGELPRDVSNEAVWTLRAVEILARRSGSSVIEHRTRVEGIVALVKAAVEAEREACAHIAFANSPTCTTCGEVHSVQAIRARSNP
jgi:hypothetical protein